MQWTAGRGFPRRRLQICEALRHLCRHHVVASVEWPCKRLPAKVLDRSDGWLALPVLKSKPGQYNASHSEPAPAGSLLWSVVDAWRRLDDKASGISSYNLTRLEFFLTAWQRRCRTVEAVLPYRRRTAAERQTPIRSRSRHSRWRAAPRRR